MKTIRIICIAMTAALLGGCMTEAERLARAEAERVRQEQLAKERKEREEREAKERAIRERNDTLAKIPKSVDETFLSSLAIESNDAEICLAATKQLLAIPDKIMNADDPIGKAAAQELENQMSKMVTWDKDSSIWSLRQIQIKEESNSRGEFWIFRRLRI